MVKILRGKYDGYWNIINLEHRYGEFEDQKPILLIDFKSVRQLYEGLTTDKQKAVLVDMLFGASALEKIAKGEDEL